MSALLAKADDATKGQEMRVHELARELGTTSSEVLDLLWSRGFFVKSASSDVESMGADWLRFEFASTPALPNLRKATNRRASRPSSTDKPWTDGSQYDRRRGVGPTALFMGHAVGRRQTNLIPMIEKPDLREVGLDLGAVEAGLRGSPYSLPVEQFGYLEKSFLPRLAALQLRGQHEAAQATGRRVGSLLRLQRSVEIYQSNRLEGLGPDLAQTHRLLTRNRLTATAGVSVAQGAVHACLQAEPKVRDVLGLGAARVLAETFCADRQRPITGTDVKDLHRLIMVGDRRGGQYKGWLNEIEGSAHVPVAPSDTPEAMGELTSWLARTSLAPVWRAAVAHAWITHIHPFHDGNGRIARLLSNLILIRGDLPPLIVRAGADRGAYISALAESDSGGDILPLARVFRDVLSRSVRDLAQPQDAADALQAELQDSRLPVHQRWNLLLGDFLSELAPHLLLHGLNLYNIGGATEDELRFVSEGRYENVWIAKIGTGGLQRDLLLHVATATTASRALLGDDPAVSIFVSIRNKRPLDARQYVPIGRVGFAYEFTPLPSRDALLLRRNSETTVASVDAAASNVAEHLARVFNQVIGRPSFDSSV
ncbi:translation initiation factor IF-2 N-terminal domain-containing protein [Aeromicrobium sp. CnD17-E]|uniref:translation initiation factor IF-2 N-terminal domain-containing protein n=1 Tax=Aeromicrobium sp. CnD17-E TaxID=2954487 RepID=UPI002098225F|nr:translation initiation factor IF-2 N-terminal domain-containing protein [Aeromicrobium sp. CnD17-E]MCO7239071.1 translation initiation factor IF-2 N-terminal domain-containing protein [Aeromicrobium sp. CnD17-E]